MKRKTLYNFNSVQLTFNQCVFNRIQYRTEHSLYSTRLDKVNTMKSSTRSVQLNTAWRMETKHRLYIMKSSSLTLYTFTLSPRFTLLHFFYTLHFPLLQFSLFDAFLHFSLFTSFTLSTFTLSTFHFSGNEKGRNDPSFRWLFRERFPADISRAPTPAD